jgi:hypothetical protein
VGAIGVVWSWNSRIRTWSFNREGYDAQGKGRRPGLAQRESPKAGGKAPDPQPLAGFLVSAANRLTEPTRGFGGKRPRRPLRPLALSNRVK